MVADGVERGRQPLSKRDRVGHGGAGEGRHAVVLAGMCRYAKWWALEGGWGRPGRAKPDPTVGQIIQARRCVDAGGRGKWVTHVLGVCVGWALRWGVGRLDVRGNPAREKTGPIDIDAWDEPEGVRTSEDGGRGGCDAYNTIVRVVGGVAAPSGRERG